MIKQVFFAAALLMPGLAYAGDPSADLPVQIVPAPSGSVACDRGPNYAGSIPAPAQAAGFTHCALNADFTSSAYSNPATWLAECGATGNALFHLTFANQATGQLFDAPCSKAQIVADPVTGDPHVFLQEFDVSDTTKPADYLELNWPGTAWGISGPGAPAGGPNGTGLWQTKYWEFTWRGTVDALDAQNSSGDVSLVYGWWMDACNGCPGNNSAHYVEVDFGEVNAAWYAGGPGAPAVRNSFNFGSGGPSIGYYVDNSIYHTLGALITTDGNGFLAGCIYLDGGIATATPTVCQSHQYAISQISTQGFGELAFWTANNTCYGKYGCMSGPIRAYIKSVRLWVGNCGYWNQNCAGPGYPVITAALDSKTRFAWFATAIEAAENWRVLSAKPDELAWSMP